MTTRRKNTPKNAGPKKRKVAEHAAEVPAAAGGLRWREQDEEAGTGRALLPLVVERRELVVEDGRAVEGLPTRLDLTALLELPAPASDGDWSGIETALADEVAGGVKSELGRRLLRLVGVLLGLVDVAADGSVTLKEDP